MSLTLLVSMPTAGLQTAVGGSGSGGLLAGSATGAGLDPTAVAVVIAAAVVLIVVLFPIARALARRMEGKAAGAGADSATAARMERLEQSVEAMSLEIERISEGQRYTTKLLTERLPLGVKVPQPGQTDKTLL